MKTDEEHSGFVELMRQWFVSKEVFELRFTPVERIVYGFAGMILLAFASAFIVLVVKK